MVIHSHCVNSSQFAGPHDTRAIARYADAPERIDNIVANRLVVDMQKPRAQALSDQQPAPDVRRHDTHRQPVLGAVGERDRLIIAIERHHDGYGSEDLFVERRVIRRNAAQHGRLEEQIAIAATGFELGACVRGAGNHASHVIALHGVNQRPKSDIAVGRVADRQAGGLRNQLLDEPVVDTALHKQAARRPTAGRP